MDTLVPKSSKLPPAGGNNFHRIGHVPALALLENALKSGTVQRNTYAAPLDLFNQEPGPSAKGDPTTTKSPSVATL
jgi:hypothetical protein